MLPTMRAADDIDRTLEVTRVTNMNTEAGVKVRTINDISFPDGDTSSQATQTISSGSDFSAMSISDASQVGISPPHGGEYSENENPDVRPKEEHQVPAALCQSIEFLEEIVAIDASPRVITIDNSIDDS